MLGRSFRYLMALAPLLGAWPAHAGQPLPNRDAYCAAPVAPQRLASAAPGLPLAVVSSRDAQRGVPTFLWAVRGPLGTQEGRSELTPEAAARAHLAAHAPRYGLSAAALSTAVVTRVLDRGRGALVVTVGQRVGGVEVFRDEVKVIMDRGLRLVALSGNLHAGAVPAPRTAGFLRSEAQALASALRDLHGVALSAADIVDRRESKGGYRYYDLGATSQPVRLVEPARVKRVYFPLPDRIVPAFYLEILTRRAAGGLPDAHAYVFAADDGRLLYRADLTHHDVFDYRLWADATGDERPADGPLADYTPYPGPAPDGSYPPFVSSSLVAIDGFNVPMDPWLAAGAVQSQGNNVDAYTDDDAPEGFSPGDTRALVTSASAFDHTFDPTLGPQASLEQREAAVTSLFYVNNWLHDWWYDSGFDEAAGDAQQDNYGRGGVGGDPLLAEGQFGAPTLRNDSSMVVPADGASPRMQAYVWDGPGTSSLTVQPGSLGPAVGVAAFGPQSFHTTGALVRADDGVGPDVNDACEPLVNGAAVSGNVALVDRGNCTYKAKAINAQAAGAVGVILVDDIAGEAPPALGNDTTLSTVVTIPILSVSQADGASLEAALAGGATATLARSTGVDRDGALDNTLVAHEWGHLLHLRQVTCTSQQCLAESEGWGDFNALMMMVREGDDLTGTYALGQYAAAALPDDPAYFGIRRYPYTTDLGKSPLTFKYLTDGVALPTTAPVATANAQAPNAEVHASGEIWASMLFEGYAAMLQQTAGSSPPYTFAEARRRMSDYVVAGMAAAPADPTYTEQRDAILAVAAAADVGDLALLAAGFAKRGAGTCAVSPARDSTDFSGVVESFTVSSNLTLVGATLDDSVLSCDGSDGYLDAGETGTVTVQVINAGPTVVEGATAIVSTTAAGVSFPKGTTVSFATLAAFASGTGTTSIALAPSVSGKETLPLTVTLAAGTGCTTGLLETAPWVNVIEQPASSTTDDVEEKSSAWTATGSLANQIWSRIEATPGNHVWAGIDYPAASDTSLVSPPLDVSPTGPLVLSFDHRHSFDSGTDASNVVVDWDGAVIEVSADQGKSWTDINAYGNPGYGGTIGDASTAATNVLTSRMGYVATNPSWPATDKVTVDMGMSLAGKTVQIRFRIGTDQATGGVGWQLDNIGLQGITNEPFASLVADTASCKGAGVGGGGATGGAGGAQSNSGGVGGGGFAADALQAGGGCGVVSRGGSPETGAELLALAALLSLRRRRARSGGPAAAAGGR